jgi:hypothetical protein
MWNPLRQYGRDRHRLNLTEEDGGKGVRREVVIVSFVFPRSAVDPDVVLVGGAAVRKEQRHSDRTVFTFRFENPPPEVYEWELRVRSFDGSPTVAPIRSATAGDLVTRDPGC